jgi:two-component sensor histidine kinase
MKILLPIVCLSLVALSLSGQANYDSLRQVIHNSDSDSVKMNAAYLISREICHTLPDSGIYYGWEAFQFAQKAGIKTGEASALSQIGYSYNKKELIDSALHYWDKSAGIYRELGDEYKAAYILTNSGATLAFFGKYDEAEKTLLGVKSTMERLDSIQQLVNVLNNLGLVYDLKGDYDQGYQYYLEAFQAAQKLDDTNGMGTSKNNMSIMYYYKGDYQKAIDYGKQAMEYWKDEKYLSGRSKAIKNIAVSYEFLGKIDSAMLMHKKAIDIDTQMNNEFGLAKTYNNLGCLYGDQGNIDLGLEYLEKALAIKSKMGIREGIASTYNYLGKLYTKKSNFKKARQFLEEGREIAESSQSPEDMKDNLSFYEEYYLATSDYKSALLSNKAFHALKDSLSNVETNTKIEELNIKYETAQKDADNALLQLENEQGRSTIARQRNMLIGGGIFLGILGLLIGYILRQRNRLKQANSELSSQKDTITILNQELNHRVKNNLAFVTTLMQMQARRATHQESKDLLKESENRLIALSKVHGSLKRGDDPDINLKNYLSDIISNLKSAFASEEKQLSIKEDILNKNLDPETAMRLGLIINELVTNSMKHIDSQQVKVKVSVSEESTGRLRLTYKDNGEGIEQFINTEGMTQSMGLQLIKILRDQLKSKVDVVLV